MSHLRPTRLIIFLLTIFFLLLVFPLPSMSNPKLIKVQNIRHSSNLSHTRVVIDLSGDVKYHHEMLAKEVKADAPYRRFYVDIFESRLSKRLKKKIPVNDKILKRVRAGQFDNKTVRVVLDIESFEDFKVFTLKDPARIVIDVMAKGSMGLPAVVVDGSTEPAAEELAEGNSAVEPPLEKLAKETPKPGNSSETAALSKWMHDFALWVIIAVIALTIITFLQIIVIHAVRIIRKRSSSRFLEVCRPMVLENVVGAERELPRIPRAFRYEFMLFWNNINESLRGEARESLVRLANAMGLNKAAVTMLKKGNTRKRFMAVATLGHMRDASAWEDLKAGLSDENAYFSFASARAMSLIDAEKAMGYLIPLMATRSDWACFNMSSILKAAGPEVISAPLAEAALGASAKESLGLLKYFDLIDYSSAKDVINKLLETSRDEEVISACLKSLMDPGALGKVREFVTHECWFIRVQAAAALGRIGTEDDKERLISMLSDTEWWVRYRAAKALEKMPFLTDKDVKNIQAEHPDPFSRDILRQAIAERDFG